MKNSKKILIDTHIHSSGISKCSRVPANELVNICVEQGLNGIVLTNHYKLASVDTDFKTWCNKYIEEFHITRDYGNKLGLKVFLGVEFTLNSMPQNDFTVYGLSEDFLLSSNPLFELTLNEFIKIIHQENALIFQAHPFRNTHPIDGMLLDGVEINCHPLYHTNEKQRVMDFANRYDIRVSCGSDYHGDTYKPYCGVLIDSSINSTEEYVRYIRETKRPELIIADI